MGTGILCMSDTHGRAPAPFDARDVVAILHGGDFYEGRVLRYATGRNASADGLAELKRVTDLRWMDGISVPIFAVRGNHDVADPLGVFERARDITGRVVEIAPGVLVTGIGWNGEHFFDLPTERDIERVCDGLRRELSRCRSAGDRLILLTHYPGKFPELFPSTGIAGSWWYESIRAFISDTQPELVVQGHLHEHAGMSGTFPEVNEGIRIVNPGAAGQLVEFDFFA